MFLILGLRYFLITQSEVMRLACETTTCKDFNLNQIMTNPYNPTNILLRKKKSQFELEQTGLAKEALMVKNINYNRRRRNENGSLKMRGCIPYST